MKYFEYVSESKKLLESHKFDPSIIYSLIYKFNPLINSLVELTNYFNDDIDENIKIKIDKALDELVFKHKPLGYILGYVWFIGSKFYVNDNVLIPRVETEYWTEKMIDILDEFPQLKILDCCCGSGVIGLMVKKQLSRMNVTLSDISDYAIEDTILNAKNLKLNVNIVKSDLFANLKAMKFDVIVCNPPYINKNHEIDSSVKDFEPHLALFAEKNGLSFYERILDQIKYFLNDKYMLFFEIGYNQADDVIALIKQKLNANIDVWKDQYNQDRVIFVKGN